MWEEILKKKGLWANIHAKRERGEKPAKEGDEDYPDASSWQKVTSKKETLKAHCGCKECEKDFEELEKFKRRFKKVVTNKKTGRKKTVKYGQAGKAKDGGDRIRPNTSKGDAYCARSNKIKGDWRSDPNSPNNLSRKKWKCHGNKSSK
tara:strand:+ start:44030 stop:44473 length:444 start_codon:yes stop_codon:yes gene_type:complete